MPVTVKHGEAVKTGTWDGDSMFVNPWWIGPGDFSVIEKL